MAEGASRIPARFAADVVRELGHGGEARVYELRGGRVLRLFHKDEDQLRLLERVAPFYASLSGHDLPFAVPEILEYGVADGAAYSCDRLIAGRAFHDVLPGLDGAERERALDAFTDAAGALAGVGLEGQPYGEFLFDDPLTGAKWADFLVARLDANYVRGRSDLAEAMPDVDDVVDELRRRIRALPDPPKVLAHGDYFPGNVLMDDGLRVTGVIDFGWLTVAGDGALDLASAAIFLSVVRGHRPSDAGRVHARLLAAHGAALAPLIEIYRGWYAVRFSPYRAEDPSLFAWCVESLATFRARAL